LDMLPLLNTKIGKAGITKRSVIIVFDCLLNFPPPINSKLIEQSLCIWIEQLAS
jgi:hypothetical protein